MHLPNLSAIKLNRAIAAGAGIGFGGGLLFAFLGLPLPWTLGSLAAVTIASVGGIKVLVPNGMQACVRPAIGILAGSAFTPEVAALLSAWIVEIAVVLTLSAAYTGVGYVLFRRLFRHDPATAFFASAPGGMAELTMLGMSYGGNVRMLAMAHALRVTAVVFGVPFLVRALGAEFDSTNVAVNDAHEPAGAVDFAILAGCGVTGYLFGRMPIPGGAMIATAALSVLVHATGLTNAALPPTLIIVLQIVIGTAAGSRFFGITAREMKTVVLQAVVWSAVLLLLSIAAATGLSLAFDRSMVSFLLAIAPGGIAEMTLITYAIGIDVAFIITCQILRILLSLIGAPLAFRLLPASRKSKP